MKISFKFSLLILLITISSQLQAQKNVSITKTIDIPVSKDKLFNYISDLNNDVVWRAEVDSMVQITSPKYGKGFTEYSSFGKKRTITPTYVTENKNHKIVYTTPDTAKYYLQSIREVTTLENGESKFTYTLIFDNKMTRETAPFVIPKFLTKMFYGSTMKKYLKVLAKEFDK